MDIKRNNYILDPYFRRQDKQQILTFYRKSNHMKESVIKISIDTLVITKEASMQSDSAKRMQQYEKICRNKM